ncbi:histidine ammonia-lyase [Patescibacteria group bacterium]|nr:histidine ammonia-lyase [Patescibacteria group bacterium]
MEEILLEKNIERTSGAGSSNSVVLIDGSSLTIEQVWQIAHKKVVVEISPFAITKIQQSRDFVVKAAQEGKKIYGLTTGFAAFKDVLISEDKIQELSRNIILSHSTSVGQPYSEEVVRAAMLVRVNSLIKGYSGIQIETAQMFADMLNNHVYPHVPSKGSVGASGDLSPLCHIVSVMIGEGEAIVDGKRVSGSTALASKGLQPIKLGAKEGLALSNGTSVHTAQAVLNVVKAGQILKTADIALSLSLEAFMGSINPFVKEIHDIRPHRGQIESAQNVRLLSQGSELIDFDPFYRAVQDSYSLRCAPQVHGAAREAYYYVRKVVETEINSATDNPLIFADKGLVLSGGNFHGEPVAIAMDTLCMAVAEIASISERRVAKMVDEKNNHGLPAYLISSELGGLNSGLMMVQYTAAALVSENKVLSHPSSVDSIPTSANVEDHVSMAANAARHAEEVIENSRSVLAIEFICAAQGLEFRDKDKLSIADKTTYNLIRSVSPAISQDRELYNDIESVNRLLRNNLVVQALEQAVGKLA